MALLVDKLPPHVYKQSRVLRARYITRRMRSNLRFVRIGNTGLPVVLHSCKISRVHGCDAVRFLNDEKNIVEKRLGLIRVKELLHRVFIG